MKYYTTHINIKLSLPSEPPRGVIRGGNITHTLILNMDYPSLITLSQLKKNNEKVILDEKEKKDTHKKHALKLVNLILSQTEIINKLIEGAAGDDKNKVDILSKVINNKLKNNEYFTHEKKMGTLVDINKHWDDIKNEVEFSDEYKLDFSYDYKKWNIGFFPYSLVISWDINKNNECDVSKEIIEIEKLKNEIKLLRDTDISDSIDVLCREKVEKDIRESTECKIKRLKDIKCVLVYVLKGGEFDEMTNNKAFRKVLGFYDYDEIKMSEVINRVINVDQFRAVVIQGERKENKELKKNIKELRDVINKLKTENKHSVGAHLNISNDEMDIRCSR